MLLSKKNSGDQGAIQTGLNDEDEPIYEDFEHTLSPVEARSYWNGAWRMVQSIHL